MKKKFGRFILGILALLIIAAAVIALIAKPIPSHPYFENEDFLVMAHRGGRDLWIGQHHMLRGPHGFEARFLGGSCHRGRRLGVCARPQIDSVEAELHRYPPKFVTHCIPPLSYWLWIPRPELL